MYSSDSIKRLHQQLCELKLEERRVNSDIRQMVSGSALIDFFRAKELNSMRGDVKSQIKNVESRINPNIIA